MVNAMGGGEVQHVKQCQKQCFGKQNAEDQSQNQAEQGAEQGFEKQNQCHMALFKPQHTVQAQFFFPALDQKAVGIEQKRYTENCNHNSAEKKDGDRNSAAADLQKAPVHGDGLHDVISGDADNAGEHIGPVGVFVFAKIVQCKFGVEVKHGRRLPWSAWSAYRRFWRTFHRLCALRDTADERPARP